MAIKQRALKKLDMTKKYILGVMRTRSKAGLGEVYRNLTESRDLYRDGLPRSGYATYEEIYDGLILAVQKVMEGEEANFQEEVLALCQELLEYLERETAKETRFKKEIFFLPYKLSMWDSLESVWKAACEDKEHCIAYVMPIPYADRNPDQTVAAWHCERDQFPKDVPTLDWQQVDLKAWHPDIIVYHSPYDDCNAVTSVDERYYSRNLRYCADKLVYIPYFVLDEIEPGNEVAEENIAHFITAPGVLNADLIVVQSEKMRQVYINVLARHTNQGKEYWKKHVSGAGSPKIEKVLTSKKEDFEMPEKWKRLVEGRKVILYNTSLSAMLQNSDKVCDKLRYVFDVFRNRDDVVLWWRPHPLMKATFHSMRPQFEDEYLSLEKQYIREGWGIYDDSPDLHRAICWSDAYYGDTSSVVNLYKQTGKYVIYQDIEITCKTEKLFFPNAIIKDVHMYFFDAYRNMLCRYNMNVKHVNVLKQIPSNALNSRRIVPYGMILCEGSTFILFPWEGDLILEYDVKTNRLEYHRTVQGKELEENSFYHYLVEYQDICYCIPVNSYMLIKYDKREKSYSRVERYENVLRSIDQEYKLRENGRWLIYGYCVVKSKFFLLCSKTNLVLEFDMETCHIDVHSIGRPMCGYKDIKFDGMNFYLLHFSEEKITKYNLYQDRLEEYHYDEGKNTDCPYSFIILSGKNILLCPGNLGIEMTIDKDSGEIIEKRAVPYTGYSLSSSNDFDIYLEMPKSYDRRRDGRLYVSTLTQNRLMNLDTRMLVNFLQFDLLNDTRIYDEKGISIERLISHILESADYEGSPFSMMNLVGRRIYEYFR